MRIDVTQIEGYENMTAEEKLAALETFDVPDPDYSGYVRKDLFDKTASELAAKKRELTEKMSEEEQRQLKEQEEREDLQRKYEELLNESRIAKNKANLLGLGYDDALAQETAEAMAAGNQEKVFANQKKHLESFEKHIRAEALKNTPKPQGGGGNNDVTLDTFRKMSLKDRIAFSKEHPEEYKQLYQGGNG